jgi:hypothetical protein
MTPTGAARNSPTTASTKNAQKLCAKLTPTRVSVDVTNVASIIALCAERRSANPDHRKEAGAEVQGFRAAKTPIWASVRPLLRYRRFMNGHMQTMPAGKIGIRFNWKVNGGAEVECIGLQGDGVA